MHGERPGDRRRGAVGERRDVEKAFFQHEAGSVLALVGLLSPCATAYSIDDPNFQVKRSWTLDELGIPNSGIQDIRYAKSITFSDPDGIPL